MTGAPRIVDARGLRCPIPVIRLAAEARTCPPGSELTLLADDPAVRTDVPAWARMRGHVVQAITQESDHLELRVVLAEGRTDATRAGP